MHDETRGVRYFNMHRLTGAELTKLIAVKLVYTGMLGTEITPVLHQERRRILSEVYSSCQIKKRVKSQTC